jgi:hypothetical protein
MRDYAPFGTTGIPWTGLTSVSNKRIPILFNIIPHHPGV